MQSLFEKKDYDTCFTEAMTTLKEDYRNHELWSLLGQIYEVRASSCHSKSDFNFYKSKASVAFIKSVKYAHLSLDPVAKDLLSVGNHQKMVTTELNQVLSQLIQF